MVGAEMSVFVSISLIAVAAGCLARLAFLQLIAVYPAFVFFLLSQIATTLSSYAVNVRTGGYARTFLVLIIIEWLSYGFMIRELYNAIFSRYPGIAILGQWSIYGALLAAISVFAFGIESVRERVEHLGTMLVAVEFVSHCLLFGFAAFILILLIAISRYPLKLHKNIFFNFAFFSAILLGEIAELLANQVTSRHFTAGLNLSMSVLGIFCFTVWPMLLSREGQTNLIDIGGPYDSDDEARLLQQLSTINDLLLRAVRK